MIHFPNRNSTGFCNSESVLSKFFDLCWSPELLCLSVILLRRVRNKVWRLCFWCALSKLKLFVWTSDTHKKLQYVNNYNHWKILHLVLDLNYFSFHNPNQTLIRYTYWNTKPWALIISFLSLFDMQNGLWVWRRSTNRRPCCPVQSTSSRTAWPDGSGRWDNRVSAQHLPGDLVWPSSG